MEQSEITNIAYDILSWVQSACSDLANNNEIEAERLYNDKDTLADLIMQKAYDDSHFDAHVKMQIIKEIYEITYHSLIKEICREYIGVE